VSSALGNNSAEVEKQLNEDVNAALEKIAKGKAAPGKEEAPTKAAGKELRDAARDLYQSKQTITVMCREEAAADPKLKDQYEQSDPSERGGGAATKGDFDKSGKPKKKGNTIIVVECARLKIHGWYGKFGLGDTMIGTLGHEFVHASNAKRVHGDDETAEQIYRRFDRFFARVTTAIHESLDEKRQREARRKRREERKRKRLDKEKAEKGKKGKKPGSSAEESG
jgi:hypothetical protein